ncbi:MAG: hypothetical protein ACK4HV_00385, partial [Parachlamydiaceae bacterium]
PNFLIEELTNCVSLPILLTDRTPASPGIHYIVEHTHPQEITNGMDLHLIHTKICWDITLLTKILNTIPLHFRRACEILSREIASDLSLKAFLEIRMSTNQPSVSDLDFTPEELTLLEKDLPQEAQTTFFT